MSLKSTFTQLFLFDKDKQDTFLVILASQVRKGRPLQEVFKSFLRNKNQYYRKLAVEALDPKKKNFAEGFGEYFPSDTAKLLTLAQTYNVIPDFIERTLTRDDKSISFFDSVLVKSSMEIVFFLVSIASCVGFYLFVPEFLGGTVDVSQSKVYILGRYIVVLSPVILGAILVYLSIYLGKKHEPGAMRESLKSLGFYNFYDSTFTINLFTSISIMFGAGANERADIRSLIVALSGVYGSNKLRRNQFAILSSELSKGKLFRDALYESKILSDDTLDIFSGLAPDEGIEEIANASDAVSDMVRGRTKADLASFAKQAKFYLTVCYMIALYCLSEISLGIGVKIY